MYKCVQRCMEMESAGKRLLLFRGVSDGAPLVVLNTVHGEGESVYDAIKGCTDADFSLVCVGGLDWDNELSPWRADPLSNKEPPFSGGADEFLGSLTDEIVPDAVSRMGIRPSYKALAGYSLAGLFSVYSVYRTDMFSRIASASGSLWFPGFVGFVKDNQPVRLPGKAYFSLGDREAKTRNPVLATVEDSTKAVCESFREKGAETVFEMNPGNHFKDPAGRTAKGIAWILDSR